MKESDFYLYLIIIAPIILTFLGVGSDDDSDFPNIDETE
jgi:hypothetical protein